MQERATQPVSGAAFRSLLLAAGAGWGCLLMNPTSASADAPREEASVESVPADTTPSADAEEVTEEEPRRAPLCTQTKLRLVGAIAASVNSFALVRSPAGTALLSPGERLNGHELLMVGAHQALMLSPGGDPCRLLLYHRSDADKVKSRRSRARSKRARQRRRHRKRRR